MLTKIFISFFIVAHGLVYLLYFVKSPEQNWPFTFEKSLLSGVGGFNLIAKMLVIGAVLGFVIAGITLLMASSQSTIWQVSLVIAIAISLLVQLAYWQNQLILGVLINLSLLYMVIFTNWLK